VCGLHASGAGQQEKSDQAPEHSEAFGGSPHGPEFIIRQDAVAGCSLAPGHATDNRRNEIIGAEGMPVEQSPDEGKELVGHFGTVGGFDAIEKADDVGTAD
jgi:hypothetical protein